MNSVRFNEPSGFVENGLRTTSLNRLLNLGLTDSNVNLYIFLKIEYLPFSYVEILTSLMYHSSATVCTTQTNIFFYSILFCSAETVKDLIRYLRRDDENHEIRRQLGETQVLRTDLLPILKEHWKEKELFDCVLR